MNSMNQTSETSPLDGKPSNGTSIKFAVTRGGTGKTTLGLTEDAVKEPWRNIVAEHKLTFSDRIKMALKLGYKNYLT